MKKMNFKSESGFTLMELMVVVGVLAILIAILLPQFTGYTAQAQAVSAAAEAKSALTAGYSYYVSATSRGNSSTFNVDTAVERMLKAVKDEGGSSVVKGAADGTGFTYTTTKGGITFKAEMDLSSGTFVTVKDKGTLTNTAGGTDGKLLCGSSSDSKVCGELEKEGALDVQ